MEAYLNPEKTAFEEAVNSEIFVDKTQMIQYLNSVVKTKQKYVSVSRPRRFGKTMAADMICACKVTRYLDERQERCIQEGVLGVGPNLEYLPANKVSV